MKVAISLPDPVFKAAELLAQKTRKSRSQLYAEAISEYVGSRSTKAITAKLDAVYARESSDVDIALRGGLTFSLVAKVKAELEEEISAPYTFDIVHYETIETRAFKRHIDTYGKLIYKL